jgi:site-specific recombinase XerC
MHSSDVAIPGEDLLGGFQEYLRSEGVSFRTRAAYCTDLRNYLRHANGTRCAAVTASDIERYISAQASRGMRHATVRRRLAGIRRFFDYLVSSGALSENPAGDVVLGARDDAALPEKHILSIFRFLRLRSRQVSPRRAMAEELAMMLMMFVGLRQRHIERLSRTSLEPRNGAMQLKLTGGEAVEIDGPVLGHFRAYLRHYPTRSGPLFLSTRAVKRLLGEIASGLGIELDHRRIHRTYLWLRTNPEQAYALLSRIEDIHE